MSGDGGSGNVPPFPPAEIWRWRSPEDLESSTAFEWLQELTELSMRVESEKIEEAANSERSGVLRPMMSEAV